MSNHDEMTVFEREIYKGQQFTIRVAVAFGLLGMVFGGSAYIAKIMDKPEVIKEPYVIWGDARTGVSEQLLQVKPAPLEQRGALIQSALVSYVTDRESYYTAGIDERINSVLVRSEGQANSSLVALWSSSISKENYPPTRYGSKTYVSVKVVSVKIPRTGEAIVRFSKTKSSSTSDVRTQFFEAVIGYKVAPGVEKSIQKVWDNPIGFFVTNYNVSAENIGAF